MARNRKLTGVLRGRRLSGLHPKDGGIALAFDDGSIMTVKLGGPPPVATPAGVVKAVRQQDVKLSLDLEDGTAVEFTTAEATSCVIVRDRTGSLEYAD